MPGPELLAEGAALDLIGQDVRGNALQPPAVFGGVLHPHQPCQRQQHAAAFLLKAVGPPTSRRVGTIIANDATVSGPTTAQNGFCRRATGRSPRSRLVMAESRTR